MINFFLWFLLFAIFEAILIIIQLPLRKGRHNVIKLIVFAAKLFLIILLSLTVVAFDTWFSWHFTHPVCALYIALTGDAECDFICGAFHVLLTRIKLPHHMKKPMAVSILSIAFGFIYLVYGTLNMQLVRQNNLTFCSDKIRSQKTFVFMADLHVGSSQSFKTLEKTVCRIRDLGPDFIVLGGDVVDEFTTEEEMKDTFALFGSLHIPVYYVYGNHDRQESSRYIPDFRFSNEELNEEIKRYGIHILRDSYEKISDDLVILGREDASAGDKRTKAEYLQNPFGEAYLLCIDHQPYETDDILKTGADLQLSGHTHAGQLFPLKGFYSLLGLNAYGQYRIGDTTLYVTAGESGWSVPFRTEEHCAYEVITLKNNMVQDRHE